MGAESASSPGLLLSRFKIDERQPGVTAGLVAFDRRSAATNLRNGLSQWPVIVAADGAHGFHPSKEGPGGSVTSPGFLRDQTANMPGSVNVAHRPT